MAWHQKEIKEVFEELNASPKGLSSEEARQRLGPYGHNALKEKKRKTLFKMFMDQFSDFMVLVFIGAAIISGLVGEVSDTIAIVVLRSLLGGRNRKIDKTSEHQWPLTPCCRKKTIGFLHPRCFQDARPAGVAVKRN